MRTLRAPVACACAVTAALSACGTPPTRAEDPARYALVASGRVPAALAPVLVDCLTDEFTRLNRGNTAFSVKQTRRANGLRVEVYSSNVILGVSSDVFTDGRTELHIGPDPLGIYSKEPIAYRRCVAALGSIDPAI